MEMDERIKRKNRDKEIVVILINIVMALLGQDLSELNLEVDMAPTDASQLHQPVLGDQADPLGGDGPVVTGPVVNGPVVTGSEVGGGLGKGYLEARRMLLQDALIHNKDPSATGNIIDEVLLNNILEVLKKTADTQTVNQGQKTADTQTVNQGKTTAASTETIVIEEEPKKTGHTTKTLKLSIPTFVPRSIGDRVEKAISFPL